MLTKFKRNLLSACVLVAFFLIAVASKVNKIHGNAFGAGRTENPTGSNYVVLNDGTKITGSKISWKSGAFTKDQVRIDDQKFKMNDVEGYMDDGTYYKRSGKDFMVRLVHGTLNIYRDSYQVTSTSTSPNGGMRTTTSTRYIHYVQRGDHGGMTTLADQKDIIEAVKGCPLAEQLADISNKKMRKSIRKNRRYLNEIFEIYNNNCKPVE